MKEVNDFKYCGCCQWWMKCLNYEDYGYCIVIDDRYLLQKNDFCMIGGVDNS